jgi:hypothetical protein
MKTLTKPLMANFLSTKILGTTGTVAHPMPMLTRGQEVAKVAQQMTNGSAGMKVKNHLGII